MSWVFRSSVCQAWYTGCIVFHRVKTAALGALTSRSTASKDNNSSRSIDSTTVSDSATTNQTGVIHSGPVRLARFYLNGSVHNKVWLALWAVALEILTIMGEAAIGLLELFIALASLFVFPVCRIFGNMGCTFKDADWGTWMAKDKPDYWTAGGKVAWITGASSGVGASLANKLAERGVSLIISGRCPDTLEKTKASIVDSKKCRVQPSDILVLPMELTHINEIPGAVEKAFNFKKKINFLFNNAGMLTQEAFPPWIITEDILNVNLLAPMRLTQEVLSLMLPPAGKTSDSATLPSAVSTVADSNTCHIVFINSLQGMVSIPGRSVYATSKHALKAYSRSLEEDLRGSKFSSIASLAVNAMGSSGSAQDGGVVQQEGVVPFHRSYVGGLIEKLWKAAQGSFCKGMCSKDVSVDARALMDIYVTSVYGGYVHTELTAKRLDSKHPRVKGIQGGKGGKPSPMKDVLPESKTGMTSDRFADLTLAAVSNKLQESWIAKFPEMMIMHLQNYVPDLAMKMVQIGARSISGVYERQEKEAEAMLVAITGVSSSRNSGKGSSTTASLSRDRAV